MYSTTLKMKELPIYAWGDNHGDWKFIHIYIKTKSIENINIIQVGDFGIGYNENDNERLEELNDLLYKSNIFLYAIRGNHDDPYYFKGHHIDRYSNIFLLPDYTILEYNNEKILCIGGATSVDRKYSQEKGRKIRRVLWWKDEVFKYNQVIIDEIKENNNITAIVTHTIPSNFYPYASSGFPTFVTNFARKDPMLIQDLYVERSLMDKLYNEFCLSDDIKLWIYGHFHAPYEEKIGNTTVKLLGIDEIWDTKLDRL